MEILIQLLSICLQVRLVPSRYTLTSTTPPVSIQIQILICYTKRIYTEDWQSIRGNAQNMVRTMVNTAIQLLPCRQPNMGRYIATALLLA